MRLAGATSLLTGAGGGVGRYIARALGAEGANLVLSDQPEAAVAGLARELAAAGVTAEALPLDLADAEQLRPAAVRLYEAADGRGLVKPQFSVPACARA